MKESKTREKKKTKKEKKEKKKKKEMEKKSKRFCATLKCHDELVERESLRSDRLRSSS